MTKVKRKTGKGTKSQVQGYYFVLPASALIVGLVLFPLFLVTIISFSRFNLYTLKPVEFLGFKNFVVLLRTKELLLVLKNTCIWIVGCVITTITLGFFSALILDRRFIGRALFRIVILMPWVVPGIVVAYTWVWMYNFDYGILNHVLRQIGLGRLAIPWLSLPAISLLSIMITQTWWGYPFPMMMILAGLQAIPQELRSAAKVDGANAWQILRYITIPLLKPVITVVTLFQVIFLINGFTLVYVMTGGGPFSSSEILGVFIYRKGFVEFNLEVAAAAAVLTSIVSLLIIVLYVRILRTRGELL